MTTNILMVDDEEYFCNAVAEYFHYKGCKVQQTFCAEDFLKKLKESIPDIFFIDKMISGFNGFDLIKEIRSQKKFEKIPIIVITASPLKSDVTDAIQLGANELYHKPIFMEDLYSSVKKNIALSKAQPNINNTELEL